jgi:protein involved in polysaccharide export with SLBB domain
MLTSDASNRGWIQRFSDILICAVPKKGMAALWRVTVLALLVAGCTSPQQVSPPPQAMQMEGSGDYRLSANDLIDFRIFQEPDFDAVIRIAGDGTAIFPMIGKVEIEGKTVGEATEMLRQRYMAGYLANPQVNLTVRTYAKRIFTILGQVQKPGTYEIEGNESISLLQAIGMAGGYTRIANPSKVVLKRNEGGVEKVYHFNAKKMARSESESTFRILPGDVITVAESIF